MADSAISQYLKKILAGVYGEDVRQAIHDAISQCYSDVNNPTLNTDALQKIVQEKIDDGTIANLSIGDGSVSLAKLNEDLIQSTEIPDLYISKVLYDLIGTTKGLNRGSFVDNVPNNAFDGTIYYTDYISLDEYESLTLLVGSGNPYIRFYDADRNFISAVYGSGLVSAKAPDDAKYIILEGNLASNSFGGMCKLCYNGKFESKTFAVDSKGTERYIVSNGVMETDEVGTQTELIPIIKGESYIFDPSKNGYIYYYNASGVKLTNHGVISEAEDISHYATRIYIPSDGEVTQLSFGGYNSAKATLTGKFFIQKMTNPDLKLVNENFDSDILVSLRKLLNIGAGTGGTFYNALDYGLTETAEDNTAALQSAIDAASDAGGGIIWIPKGIYCFKSSRVQVSNGGMEAAVWAKSRVSIMGESLSGTVLKMTGDSANGHGFTLFGYYDNMVPLDGCSYMNFTVDGSDATITEYNHHGKAFHYHNITDCVFRDLRLLNTPATALGIDMLVNTVIDSIYCENCGREWVYMTGNGGAGIGIGTGKFQNENYVIRNCVCVGCGHFGIFLEDQGLFSAAKDKNYPKGAIITNNICRNGRYGGIGLRGGRYVLIQNNICYENHDAGIEIDYGIKECDVLNNTCYDNGESGIAVENVVDGVKENLNFSGNRLTGNAIGIKINSATEGLVLSGNIVKGNTSGITAIAGQNNSVIQHNVIVDSKDISSGNFTGDTSMNELQ